VFLTQEYCPNRYPFEQESKLVKDCKTVVKHFRNHHQPKQQLEAAQKAAGPGHPHLVLPGDTRFGSAYTMLDKLNKSQIQLYAHTHTQDYLPHDYHPETNPGTTKALRESNEPKYNLQKIVSSEFFKVGIPSILNTMKPFVELMTELQGDKVPLSRVYDKWLQLYDKIELMHWLNDEQRQYVSKVTKYYWNFVTGVADGVAYLLDPHFVGEHLTQDEEDKITTFIVNYVNSDIDPNATVPAANSEEARNLIKETSDLRIKMKDELNSFLAAARENKANKNDKFNNLPTHPKDYWKINQRHYPNLYTLALKVFNIPAGTASSERTFSAEGFIRSKLRNRLVTEKVKKILFIKLNDDEKDVAVELEGCDSEQDDD
jgi:hypothetical protein